MRESPGKLAFPEMLKLGLILALYAAAACAGLALVYTATAERIAGQAQRDLETALGELFPGAGGFEDMSGAIKSPGGGIEFGDEYQILRGNEVIGLAIRATGSSYGGPLTALVGIGADGAVSGVKILEHKDTPGLGANAASPGYYVDKPRKITFYGQFAGKSTADPFEVKRDVQAVTASTITSRAVAGIVKAAALAAEGWFKGGGR
jgi:electron transport complex protein RnfG